MPEPAWVLVKGWHDSGAIDGVYGPYSKARAEWIRAELPGMSSQNWTLHELRDFAGPQPAAEPAPELAGPEPPAPARTEISNTSAGSERRWTPHVSAPATPFGFRMQP